MFSPSNGSKSWDKIGQLSPDQSAGSFGFSVAMTPDGNRVVIGAPPAGVGFSSGSVRGFEYFTSKWIQVGSTLFGEVHYNDHFGWSVTISEDGKQIAIGSLFNINNYGMSGSFTIYEFDEGDWRGRQIINGFAAGDRFGYSASFSADGSRLAVGAIYDDAIYAKKGYVQVFYKMRGRWKQLGNMLNGQKYGDYFGFLVAISSTGDRIIIGSPQYDDVGQVQIFHFDKGNWLPLGRSIIGDKKDHSFGRSVAMCNDGSRVAVGAIEKYDFGLDSGSVIIFDYDEEGYCHKLGNPFLMWKEAINLGHLWPYQLMENMWL